MLNAVLLSFFFAAPAFVAVIVGRGYTTPLARGLMVGGGALAVLLATLAVLPMLGCSGDFHLGFSKCIGGAPIDALAARTLPVIRGSAMIYILVLVPLGLLAWAIESLSSRRRPAP